MQFITTALLPVIALLTATAHAADCYSQHGSKSCLSRDDLYFARDNYCSGDYWKTNNLFTARGSNGWQGSFAGTNIPNQKLCWDGTADVINWCLGNHDGGYHSQTGWAVNINFCGA